MEMQKKWIMFFTSLTISIIIPVSVLALHTLGGNRLIIEISTDKLLTSITIPPFGLVRCFNHTPEDHPLMPGTYEIEGLVVGFDNDRTTITIS